MQQATHGQATHGCKFRGLVQNGIAHKQAWHEHIATYKPGVVPCRYIANQTQRNVLNLFTHAVLVVDRFCFENALGFCQKEINASQEAI